MTKKDKKQINEKMILERIRLVEKHIERLKKLKKLSKGEFALQDNFAIASYNLRCALEAVFDIGGHIISRIPGAGFASYKDIAQRLGNEKIIPKKFAYENLTQMAGYRNRITHFYFEISPAEMRQIIQENLSDFNKILKNFKRLLNC